MIVERLEAFFKKTQALTSIKFELTNACNLKCVHCYVENRGKQYKRQDLQLESIRLVLEQVKEMGATNIVLTGGEPMLHPEFEKIVDAIKDMNFILTLFTNATLINHTNISCIKKCDLVEVTRYGCTQTTYEQTTGIRGSYLRYLAAIELLSAQGVRFVERAMLLKTNETDVEDFYNICENRIGTYIFAKNGDAYAADARASDATLLQYYRKAYTPNNFVAKKSDEPVCNFAEANLCVKCNGDIVPCINWPVPLGNIFKNTIKEIWEGEPIQMLRKANRLQTFKKCFLCEDNIYLTHLCPSDNMYETSDLSHVSSEKCRICQLKKRAMREGV